MWRIIVKELIEIGSLGIGIASLIIIWNVFGYGAWGMTIVCALALTIFVVSRYFIFLEFDDDDEEDDDESKNGFA